ncbi:MAG: hypothetical protein AAB583_03965 [Patescibacteria group bacterium]
MNIFSLLIILLKILLSALMLKFPVFGLWGNYFLDVIDGDILLSLGLTDQNISPLFRLHWRKIKPFL